VNLKIKPLNSNHNKINKNSYKFKVLNEYSNKLSGDAFKLFYILIDFYNESYGYAYPSYRILLDKTGIKSVNTLKKKLNELVEIGLLNIVSNNQNNKYTFNNVFELKEVKQENFDTPLSKIDDQKSKFDTAISKFDSSSYNKELNKELNKKLTKQVGKVLNIKSKKGEKSMYDVFLSWASNHGCILRTMTTLINKIINETGEPPSIEWYNAFMRYVDDKINKGEIKDVRTFIGKGLREYWSMTSYMIKPKEKYETPQWQLDRRANEQKNAKANILKALEERRANRK
jgi:hypothetical protein